MSNKVITFDFDDTIIHSQYDNYWGFVDGKPNYEIIKLIKNYKKSGNKVYIVTSRNKSEKDLEQEFPVGHPAHLMTIQEFLNNFNVKVDDVLYTNGDFKWETLLEIGSNIHYENDDEEISYIMEYAPNIKIIKVSDSEKQN